MAGIIVVFAAFGLCLNIVVSACPGACSCYGKTVDCIGKGLTVVPSGIPLDTETLLIDNNTLTRLSSIPTLKNLKKLSASYNSIDYINYYLTWRKLRPNFLSFPVLKFLNVSNNKLTSLSSTTTRYLNNIEVLDFTNNPIKAVSSTFYSVIWPQEPSYFRITSNQYICDCRLKAFKAWYTSKPYTNVDEDVALNNCQCPVSLRGRTLKNISSTDMECAAPRIDICVNATGLGKASLNDYHVSYSRKVTAIAPITITHKPNELGCVAECHHTENCYRVSYAASTNVCELYPFSIYDNDTSTGDTLWRYSRFVPNPTNINQTYHFP